MALRYFYIQQIGGGEATLEEDVSKHITQVLRMKIGDELVLTDGKGTKAKAIIMDDHRKRCIVKIEALEKEEEQQSKVTIAISLIKNAARFEWFLEKATEIGVSEIIPIICERTEKEKFRQDRLQNILISAMLQSQQCWMPLLHEPVAFEKIVKEHKAHNKYIAHCLPEEKKQLANYHKPLATQQSSLILIGPEGDFTEQEIAQALSYNYTPVALGNTRLRTETAGMVAATLLCQMGVAN
jgi:16S rRNA (uracil1498-N3)-methyltransferase